MPWSVFLIAMAFLCGCSATGEGNNLGKSQSIAVETIHWQDDYFIADSMNRDFGSFNMFHDTSSLPTHGIFIFAPTERMAHRLVYVADNLDSAYLWLWLPVNSVAGRFSKCKTSVRISDEVLNVLKDTSSDAGTSYRRIGVVGKASFVDQTNFNYVFANNVGRSFKFQRILDSSGGYAVEPSKYLGRRRSLVVIQQWLYNDLPVDSVMASCGGYK